METRLLPPSEVARRLGITRDALADWRLKNIIQAIYINRQCYAYEPNEVARIEQLMEGIPRDLRRAQGRALLKRLREEPAG